MWGNPNGITEQDIERRILNGFGQGVGISYTPWVQKHDFGSKGTAKELLGVKVARTHHLLSQLEYHAFLIFEKCRWVLDVREQLPLFDRELVVQICRKMRCKIPYYRGTKTVYVLSTDFLLTVQTSSGPILVACAVKPAQELEKKRVRELLEVERRYWNQYAVQWWVVTDKDIDRNLWLNLRWLRQGVILRNDPQKLNADFIDLLLSAKAHEALPLRDRLKIIASKLGTALEDAVTLLKHHVWNDHVSTDLFRRIKLTEPVGFAASASATTLPFLEGENGDNRFKVHLGPG